MSAILLASKYGYNDLVELLIDNGANVDDLDFCGNSCLHYAAAFGKKSTVELLIEKGVSFYRKNNKGFSAVDYCFSDDVANHLQLCAIDLFELKKYYQRGFRDGIGRDGARDGKVDGIMRDKIKKESELKRVTYPFDCYEE